MPISTPAAHPIASPGVIDEATSVWSIAAFRSFMASMVCVTLANQMQGTVIACQVYAITRDPLSLGMLGLAEALPFITLALLGGHVADARDRRKIALVVLAVMMVAASSLVLITSRGEALGSAQRWAIYAVVVLGGLCRSFLQPARAALNAEILPPHLYAKAIAVRTGFFQLAMVVGPALGGLLYAEVGAQQAYWVVVSLLVAAWLAMRHIPATRAIRHERAPSRLASSVKEGLAYVVSDKLLFPAILLDLFGVLFGGATALLPIFANEILGVGARGFGVLRAAPAVGALAASAVLSLAPAMKRAGRAMLWSVAVFGVTIAAFALSRSLVLSVALLAVSGAVDMVSVLVRGTLLQVRVPGRLLGRVASINQIFIGSSNEIGAFESGVAARLLGVVPSVLFGGTITVVIAGLTAWRAPELRALGRLDQLRPDEPPGTPPAPR